MSCHPAARPALRPTVAHVDLGAIRHNLAVTRQLAGKTTLCAVVKADAYGHGLIPVARELAAAGADMFAVALVEEGLELRRAEIKTPILVLAGNFAGAYDAMVAHDLTPVIGQVADVAGFAAACQRTGKALAVHIEIDTGMARLGLRSDAIERTLAALTDAPALHVVGIMSHFSHSDVPGAQATSRQLERLGEALKMCEPKLPHLRYRHIINSGALVTAPAAPHQLVRCGLCLYGVQPSVGAQLPGLKPALTWETQIISLRSIAAGEGVSYGSHWVAPKPSRIATLPVGYADGYPRRLGNRAQVLVAGRRAPVIGRVCMDLSMVDVTDIDGVDVGTKVTLLGQSPAPSALELGAWSDSISWEVLSRIGPRVPRIYRGAEG